ncbi:peroxiredoxin [Inquilinus sp. CAU 1745]|uniref:peroxiredoxin n=1 Tax=Inquilinus sp. CAU 1745 TaxID=3140369 RepID=UPI00325C01A0
MPIKVGDRFPEVMLKQVGPDGLVDLDTGELTTGQTIVLFAVPGAFTPTCSVRHLPGFIDHADDFKAKGVDVIACLSVNDPWVMDAWAKDTGAEGTILMLPDGNGELAAALDLPLDASANGLGIRIKRFAMVIDDGIVTDLQIEAPGKLEVSSAEALLARL